jgi:hypothetical protein
VVVVGVVIDNVQVLLLSLHITLTLLTSCHDLLVVAGRWSVVGIVYNSFSVAIADQPTINVTGAVRSYLEYSSYALSLTGTLLVLTSFLRLGITGTYLGDYFGILMDHMVTGFPFNVLANPMYVGTTMNFTAGALWYVPIAIESCVLCGE